MKELNNIQQQVDLALEEDIGSGDITAELIDAEVSAQARIISREAAVLCGTAWVEAVFARLDSRCVIQWLIEEGNMLMPNQTICELKGNARALLTGERTALNFLQTLSATATVTRKYVEAIADTKAILLDTRKTLPGWRMAQKYAVRCGGGRNHRMGLYDAYLIKENHIAARGSIAKAIAAARKCHPGKPIEIEVESLVQLQEALLHQADTILLDNFSFAEMRQAVTFTAGRAKLEASGGVDLHTIREIALTGIDYISVGAITKHIHAIDLSMRFTNSKFDELC